MKEIRVGTLSRYPPGELASRASARVMEQRDPLALCLDPDGLVTLEPYDGAVFEEVVGVYSARDGLLALHRVIREDLLDAIAVRGITGQKARRYVRRAA